MTVCAYSASTQQGVDVFWQDNATNETGFELWRSPSRLEGTFSPLAWPAADVVTYSDVGRQAHGQFTGGALCTDCPSYSYSGLPF